MTVDLSKEKKEIIILSEKLGLKDETIDTSLKAVNDNEKALKLINILSLYAKNKRKLKDEIVLIILEEIETRIKF